jgi:hypothetical protein
MNIRNSRTFSEYGMCSYIKASSDTYTAPVSISGGLVYDQPARSGYRVYRFTSGTGTITW